MLAYFITQVWQIRINVHFVNDEGNMLDCASIACIAALRHFRKPEVTVEGTEVTVVSATTTFLPYAEGSSVALPRRTRACFPRTQSLALLCDFRFFRRSVSLL